MSDSFLYNLTRKSYEEAGFTYVRPKGQQNCVMTCGRAAQLIIRRATERCRAAMRAAYSSVA